MSNTLYNKYAETLQQVLFSIYNDLLARYHNVDAVKKEIYNIGTEALKAFGAKDPLGDKIEELVFKFNKTEDQNEKLNIKEKLVVLNKALKIITETESEDNE